MRGGGEGKIPISYIYGAAFSPPVRGRLRSAREYCTHRRRWLRYLQKCLRSRPWIHSEMDHPLGTWHKVFFLLSGEESRDSDKVDTDDEGIEQDHDDERSSTNSSNAGSRTSKTKDCMASILGLCQSHLSVESEAEAHYRNVCRALVSEALELSFFLKKTLVRAEEHSEELQQLALKDWVSKVLFALFHRTDTSRYLSQPFYSLETGHALLFQLHCTRLNCQ